MLLFNTGTALVNLATNEVVAGGGILPVNITPPSIAPTQDDGVPVGTLLVISEGAWQGTPAPSFTYRWLRGGVAIAGATGRTYRTVTADVDKVIRGEVTATSAGAAGATASTLTSNTVRPTGAPAGMFATIQAESGDRFRTWHGTRIFPSRAAPSVYSQLVDSTAGLQYLLDYNPYAVTHLITPNWGAAPRNLTKTLGNLGVKSVLTVGAPQIRYTSAQWDDMIGEIAAVGDHLLMVNGQNEINHLRGGGTLPADHMDIASDHQEQLWDRMTPVNEARRLAGKPRILVGSPNLWSGDVAQHHADLARIAPLVRNYCDVACFHLYPRGEHPDWKLDEFIGEYRKASNYGAGKPLWCTEGGYFDSANYTGNAATVTKPTKAIYAKKQWLEYAARGIPVSRFEFLDDLDPADTNREASLGDVEVQGTYLVSGWSAKPSYTALVAMNSRTGGVTGPVLCNLTVPTGVRWHAVNDDAGTTIYLWRPDNIEANRLPLALNPPTRAVTVHAPTHPLATYNVGPDVVEVRI